MTYVIKRNGKRYNSKTYENYEVARRYVRKILRNGKVKTGIVVGGVNVPAFGDRGWRCNSNPDIGVYGFSIQKKA